MLHSTELWFPFPYVHSRTQKSKIFTPRVFLVFCSKSIVSSNFVFLRLGMIRYLIDACFWLNAWKPGGKNFKSDLRCSHTHPNLTALLRWGRLNLNLNYTLCTVVGTIWCDRHAGTVTAARRRTNLTQKTQKKKKKTVREFESVSNLAPLSVNRVIWCRTQFYFSGICLSLSSCAIEFCLYFHCL